MKTIFAALLTLATLGHQLTQVGQARLQVAQLRVVQAVSGFLAVAGNERHGGAPIQQLDGGVDLGRTNFQFGRDLQKDLVQAEALGKSTEKCEHIASIRGRSLP